MLDTESRYSTVLDQKPSRDPWLTMDYYLGDSVSLQEMLDIDIKGEIEGVIGGHPDLGINFTDLSPLTHDDQIGCNNDFNTWLGSASLLNGNSNSSNSNFNLDLNGSDAASLMVNPNSVMPLTPCRRTITPRKSFTSANKIKSEAVNIKIEAELENDSQSEGEDVYDGNEESTGSESDESDDEQKQIPLANSRLISKARTSLFIPAKLSNGSFQNGQITRVTGNTGIKIVEGSVRSLRNDQSNNQYRQIYALQPATSAGQNHIQLVNSPACIKREYRESSDPLAADFPERLFPKPAYSYSCLIAMALKNSQTGSLPVSEIYNFMCEHFPYFKTAPNGWKNSVRHNLSLNKCFEKIEKPAGNGNQRKGCLWAINPSKISKMDEEVQKWSRKDPSAIKKAMIYPNLLELLEKGEMKYIANGDVSEETESSGDEETDPLSVSHNAANSVTDSYDESSQDGDVDASDHQLYDDIEIEDNKDALHMQLSMTKDDDLDYDTYLSPVSKRQKTVSTNVQRNYTYQTVVTTRRKPVFLQSGPVAGSFVKIE